MGPPTEHWRGTRFGGLALVHYFSSAGDALVSVALAGSVFVSVSLNAARGRTALGLLCTLLPFAIVGPILGPAIDQLRGGRRFVIFAAAIGRLAACLLMAAWIHSLLLFPAAFLSLVFSKTHAVARASLVPTTVDSQADLVRANSRLAVGGSVITAAAAGVGAIVYKVFGSKPLLDLDVVVFAVTAALAIAMLSPARPVAGATEASADAPGGVASDGTTGDSGGGADTGGPGGRSGRGPGSALIWRARWHQHVPPEVRLAGVPMAGMRAMAGFLTALVIFDFRRGGAPVIWYGLVAVASIGGNFSGALVAPVLRERVRERVLVGGSALMIGATAIVVTQLPADHRRPAALLLAFAVGLGASVAKTAFDAIVQRDAPDTGRSELFARFETIFQLCWVLAALIPILIPTPLLAGFIVVALVVVSTSTVFVIGATRDRRAADISPGAPAVHQPR